MEIYLKLIKIKLQMQTKNQCLFNEILFGHLHNFLYLKKLIKTIKLQRNKFGIYKFDHANMFTMLLQNNLPKIGIQKSYLLETINMWQLGN